MSTPRLRKLYSQSGFTLVELMVALVLGLILTGGVINIYISSKQTYRMQDNQSRLQENGRFALQFLTKDLRMAGYMGCNTLATITPNIIANAAPPPAPIFGIGTAVQGYDAGAWPSTFPPQPSNLIPNTSVIVVSYALPSGAFIDQPLPLPSSAIHVNANPSGWAANTVLFITDCQVADIFRANSVSASGGGLGGFNINHSTAANTANVLSKAYGTDAQVMAFSSNMYYLGSMALGTNTTCPCALFRQKFTSAPPEQLIDNVKNMQINYGVVTNSAPYTVKYVPACPTNAPLCVSTASDWSSVVSARINLLVTTPDDNLVNKPQSYTFNGGAFTAADQRLYSIFTDTITFRNRAP